MAVQLNDAKITVKLDLKDGEKQVESLEKRTIKQRKKGEQERRRGEKELRKAKAQEKRRPSLAGRVAGFGLYQMIVNVLRSLPFGAGVIVGVAAAKLELTERYGPALEGFLNRYLEKKGVPLASLVLATEAAKEIGDLKSKLASLTAGFDATVQRASADILTGGTVSAEEMAEIFKVERRFAEFSRNLPRAERAMRGRLLGAGVGESFLVNELEKAVSGSLNK